MLRLILHRLLISVPLVFVVSALTFVLISFTPGDVTVAILGPSATQQQYAQLRHQLALDQPIWVQYWHWLSQVLHGSLGVSLITAEPIGTQIHDRLGVTLSLIILSLIVSSIVGVGLGVLSAVRGGALGRTVDVLSLAGLAFPNFWLGLLLVSALAVSVKLLPATGYVPITQSPGAWLRSLVLPVTALSVGTLAGIAKQTRESMLDVLGRDFIRTLQLNGISPRSIIFQHALRNAAIPVVTLMGLLFVGLLSGTVLIEAVFALPGLGGMVQTATQNHDLPAIQGVAVVFAVIVVIVNLLVDLAYGWLDPRVRRA